MGKVLSTFENGWPGAPSRSVDEVITTMKNNTSAEIPFGAAVFLVSWRNACAPFNPASAASFSMDNFIGFTVRNADKVPALFGSNEAVFNADDPVEILVRGSIVLQFDESASPGDSVYIRKEDGLLVTDAGTAGSTLALTNVRVTTESDSENRAEVVVLERNLL